MTEKVKKSEAEEADELFAKRHASGEWSEQRVDVEVKPGRTSVVSFRLPADEVEELDEAAAEAGESLSNYIREAIGLRRQQDAFFVFRREDAIGANVLLSMPTICVRESSKSELLKIVQDWPTASRSRETQFELEGWFIPLERAQQSRVS